MKLIYYVERIAFGFFFFFQAEDGIRDADVTGVQTCALPISLLPGLISAQINPGNSGGPVMQDGKVAGVAFQGYSGDVAQGRSEERRVGKECRCRWGGEH